MGKKTAKKKTKFKIFKKKTGSFKFLFLLLPPSTDSAFISSDPPATSLPCPCIAVHCMTMQSLRIFNFLPGCCAAGRQPAPAGRSPAQQLHSPAQSVGEWGELSRDGASGGKTLRD